MCCSSSSSYSSSSTNPELAPIYSVYCICCSHRATLSLSIHIFISLIQHMPDRILHGLFSLLLAWKIVARSVVAVFFDDGAMTENVTTKESQPTIYRTRRTSCRRAYMRWWRNISLVPMTIRWSFFFFFFFGAHQGYTRFIWYALSAIVIYRVVGTNKYLKFYQAAVSFYV